MRIRKGYGIGMGMGYKNLMPMDSHIHSLSAKGVKTIRQRLSKGDKVWIKPVAFGSMGKVEVLEMQKDHMIVDFAGKKELVPYSAIQDITTGKGYDFNAKGKKNPVTEKNLVDYIIDFEGGTPKVEDVVYLFSYLVDTGKVWSLQGFYGRQAVAFIEAGIMDKQGNIHWTKVPNRKELFYGADLDAKAKKIGKKYYKPVELFSDFTDMDIKDVKEVLKSAGAVIKPLPKVDLGNLTLKNLNIDYILPIEYEIKKKDGSVSFPIMWNPNQKIKQKKGDKLIIKSVGKEEGLVKYADSVKDEYKDMSNKDLKKYSPLGQKRYLRSRDELLRRKVTK